MSNQKKLQAEELRAKVRAALAAAPGTGELPDEAMEAVAGGVALSGNQVFRMQCNKCGWISRWHNTTDGNMDPSDFREMTVDHDREMPACTSPDFDVHDVFCLPVCRKKKLSLSPEIFT